MISSTAAALKPTQRAGLLMGVIVGAICLNHLNLSVRLWFRDHIFGGTSHFVDNALLMCALLLTVWSVVGLLVLGPRSCGLAGPTRPREAWLAGVASGLGLLALIGLALWVRGGLVFALGADVEDLLANVISNFQEEFIYRGVVLGFLVALLGRERPAAAGTAVLLSALIFCQGHLHYPLPLLLVVFTAGLVWGGMTLRYRSIWPAYVSHMVADVLGALLLKA